MKNLEIKNKWINFINDDKYKKYFLVYEQKWMNTLEKIKMFITQNNRRPYQTDEEIEIRHFGKWLSHQTENYKKNQQSMLNINIKNKWENFINDDKYKKYFLSFEQSWDEMLKKIKIHIDKFNKKPSKRDKNIDIKNMGIWLSSQKQNYKLEKNIMKDINIRTKWINFINDEKYKKYLLSNEQEWNIKLEEVKKYIDHNKKRPRTHVKNNIEKYLSDWISYQINSYRNNRYIMKNQKIKQLWEEFINDENYKKYFT